MARGVVTGLAFSLLAAAALAAGVQQPQAPQRLPDGNRVALLGATLGTPLEVPLGSAWQRLLEREGPLPDSITLPGGASLVTWLLYARDYSWTSPNRPVVVLRGAGGDEWLAEPTLPGGAPDSVTGHSFRVFPRRQQTLALRVYQDVGERQAGVRRWVDFRFENPAYRAYPVWTPDPLPAARWSDGLRFELTALQAGIEGRSASRSAGQPYARASFASFRVTREGAPAPEWEPVELAIEDATGNRLESYGERVTRRDAEVGIAIQGLLPLDEPSWNVRAEFSRHRTPDEAPDHVWSARGVEIPPPGGVWGSAELAPGVVLETRVALPPAGGRVPLELRLRVEEPGDLRVGVEGALASGEPLAVEGPAWRARRGEGTVYWQAEVPAAARRFDVAFSAFNSHLAEFWAKPTRAR